MATLRELKARIGSVASSEKITGAMKMISSAKMHKAEQALRKLKPFRQQIETIIANLLSADVEFASPLLESRTVVKNIAVIVWGSDDGLCGAYNVNIYKRLILELEQLKNEHPDSKITLLPIGSKIAKQVVKLGSGNISVVNSEGVDSKSDDVVVKQFVSSMCGDFLCGKYDLVMALSTHYYTVSRQRIEMQQLLPVQAATLTDTNEKVEIKPYIFESSPREIVEKVLPLFELAMMQDLFTQNMASEQAARVMAMQSANDNAKKLLDQLRLEYNKLRQQSITNELLDIVGGQIR